MVGLKFLEQENMSTDRMMRENGGTADLDWIVNMAMNGLRGESHG